MRKVLALLSVLALAACGNGAASGGTSPEKKTIRLAYQAFPSGDLIVKNQGLLEKALPEIFTGIRLAVGVAYSSVVAAETINGVPGIGGMVRDAQRYSQTDVVVLGLFAIGLSGLLIDALLRTAENRLIPWRGRA